MRVITEPGMKSCWTAGSLGKPGLMLSIRIKVGYRLQCDSMAVVDLETAECSGDIPQYDDSPAPLSYPSDFIPFKPRADILLVGSAHPPGNQSVTGLEVGMRVGGLKKSLYTVGDRFWKRRWFRSRVASDPAPFTSMPLTYKRSFGGPAYQRNPVGLGRDKKALPNIEDPADLICGRGDRPHPAGFGPISAEWEPRRSKVGTYKGKWLKEHWPWFPDDFDWSYFNAAPEDQQVEGYLRGDEELEFQNLHPKHPLYRSRLSGLRARAFVQVELPDVPPEFREVPLKLDTLWVDMDGEKLLLVWGGLTAVRSPKFKEVTHLFVFTEPLAAPPRSRPEAEALMRQRIREEAGEVQTPEEAAEEAASNAAAAVFAGEMAAVDKQAEELNKEFGALEEQVAQQGEQEKARLIAEGIDPKILEQPVPPQSADELKALLAAELVRLSEHQPQAAANLAGVENEADELAKMEQEFAALDAAEPPPPTPATVQAALAQNKAVKGADLSGQDFSKLDLSGGDFSGTSFAKADLSGAKLAGAILTGVDFSEANLTGADLSGAVLDGADFSGAKLKDARFAGASIEDTMFSEVDLTGADFSGSKGRHPMFSESNLEGANFGGAKLPHADFCRANVTGASFIEAELTSADFGGALAPGIRMEKADLTNIRAGEKANFTGGKFREAKAPKSIWESSVLDRADFSRAVLSGALFEDCSVKETNFDRADLAKANFEDASVHRAFLTNANLLRASFNGANLTGTRLDGSNLYEASFWETVFGDTSTEGANLKRTALA